MTAAQIASRKCAIRRRFDELLCQLLAHAQHVLYNISRQGGVEMTNAKVTRLFPDAVAGASKARECAAEEREQKTRNAYYVLSDVLLELAEVRSENARLRAELAAR